MPKSIPIAVIKFAEARAAGASQQAAARESGWSLDGLRRWIRKHPAEWYRELFRARRDARDSACDEAVAMLRVQLRDDETKSKFEAANAVAKHFASPKPKPRLANNESNSEFGKIHVTISESELTAIEQDIKAAEEEDRERRIENGERRTENRGQRTEDGRL